MIIDGTSFLIYGKQAFVVDVATKEELSRRVSIPVLNLLLEKGVEKLQYGHDEDYVRIEDMLQVYTGE